MFCPDCGNQTTEGRQFCVHCGSDIESAMTPSPGGTPTLGATPASSGTPTPTPIDSISDKKTHVTPDLATGFETGSVIADRYEVVELLGQGGMGAVYRVLDRELGRECALKVMHPGLLTRKGAVERFIQEARVSLDLQHPNIIRIRDIGRFEDLRYLTMELLEGRTLREWLRQLEEENRQVSIETAVSIIIQVLAALAYAHRHTIHRDIKPENIFLQGEEEAFKVKLLDFGIAKALDREALTSTSMSLGTAWYMAPEQLKGAAAADARADLYAVGVVLYEMLTGMLPAGAFPKPTEVREELDEETDKFILGAMAQDPAKRPGNATTMAEGLRKLEQTRLNLVAEIVAPREEEAASQRAEDRKRTVEEKTQSQPSKRGTRKRSVLTFVTVVVIVLIVTVWGIWSW